MMKREAKVQTLFNQFLRQTGMHGYFELKQTEKDSIAWSSVKEHQLAGLLAAEGSGFIWKLSDEDQRRKPFDCMSAPPLYSYVVIKFPNGFYMIRASKFLKERNAVDAGRSLTEDRAFVIAEKIIHV